MRLSVVIPAYNEIRTIAEIVERVHSLPVDKEIIIVDDGSTDGTREWLRENAGERFKPVFHERNRGKGAAVRTGVQHASGDLVVVQDADLEYDPGDLVKMMALFEDPETQVVYGSRILSHSEMSYLRYWLGGRLVTLCTNLLFGSRLTDEPTCYKMFRRELIQSIELEGDGFEFCPEVTGKVLRRGIAIKEIPIRYYPRSIEEGKKIRFKDGLIAIWTLLKVRFRRDRRQG
jgi:glycosyltransferase involved in cell wall biosynthesis